MSPEHERKFTSKIQPQKKKEVELINYLLDCYESVAVEERTNPKVSLILFVKLQSLRYFFFVYYHFIIFNL